MVNVDTICYGLRFVEQDESRILQAKWFPNTLDGNHALTPKPKPSDWENVPWHLEGQEVP